MDIKKHKILVVGDWRWPWYQEACAAALEELGHEVIRFGWSERFESAERQPATIRPLARLMVRLQARALCGPLISGIRRHLVATAARHQPSVVFFYNVQLIDAGTVRAMRRAAPQAVFCQYANDNPFSAHAAAGWWRHFIASVPLFDVHFAYREEDIGEFMRHGATRVHLLRSYFIPADDYPLRADERDPRFACDVVFAGHYEQDGRLQALESLARAGLKLHLFGNGWDRPIQKLGAGSPLRAHLPVSMAYRADYRQAICGAKVALCFLSSLNRDTYTRRNFQIPAMGVAMVSQHTDDLARLFQPDIEAAFFKSGAELGEKVAWLVQDGAVRRQLAEAGASRVRRDGHDVRSRMAEMMRLIGCSP